MLQPGLVGGNCAEKDQYYKAVLARRDCGQNDQHQKSFAS